MIGKEKTIENVFPILVVCLITIGVFSGCQNREMKAKKQEVIPVKVLKVELKEIFQTLDYTGNITAQDEVLVYPKVSGKIIKKVKEDGSQVEKGDAVVYIDRDEVGLKFNEAPVQTPLTGVVGRVYVDIGSNVNTQTPVALVVNMDRVKIDLDIPEKYLPKVSLGQNAKVLVDAYPDKEFVGQVIKISPVIDLSTRTAPIEITIDNLKHYLKSGMFARVGLIIDERKNMPVILKEAIMGKEPNLYAYTIENKKAALKKISLDVHQGSYYGVKDGLKEGDLVVIVGQQRLYDGAPVEPQE